MITFKVRFDHQLFFPLFTGVFERFSPITGRYFHPLYRDRGSVRGSDYAILSRFQWFLISPLMITLFKGFNVYVIFGYIITFCIILDVLFAFQIHLCIVLKRSIVFLISEWMTWVVSARNRIIQKVILCGS